MSCSRWCTLRETRSMALPPGSRQQPCCLEAPKSGHAGDICTRSLHCRAARLCCKLSNVFQSARLTVLKNHEGILSLWPGSSLRFVNHIWLWMSGSGRQSFAGGREPRLRYRDTSDLAEMVLLARRGSPRPGARRGLCSASRWA